MRGNFRRGVFAGLAGAALCLAACDGKETGPSPEASPQVPDVATPVAAATAEPDMAKQDLGFAGADADRDGRVSSAEYAASSSRLFTAMDTDDNGTLTVAELDAARGAMQISGAISSEKLIDRADNDGDDKLTLAEFIADVNARFALVDANRDSWLSPAEYYSGHPEIPGSVASQVTVSPTPPPPSPR